MTELRVANSLSLDLDAVTKTFAILAQRRKGKTYTASIVAEELVKAGQPWVALDPTGAWWGLRAGADGSTKGGLPVYVFGGQHGDLPLERTAGKVIADLVVDEPRFYVLDLSAFESKEAERQFATDFAERLYRRKAKKPDPLHLFVDEADVFVPQRIPKGDPRMVGAFEAIVRRGGIRGIGTTLISQRAAVVNKNVLEQIDVLIVLRIVGPNDQKAIKAYIEAHGSEEERAELMGSLASLKLGEAWIWEPGSEPALFERTQIRERHTYNSSATPKAGEAPSGPVQLAGIDLDSLRGQIEATVEKAKAEDPKELRKELRERDAEIKRLAREIEGRPEPEPTRVEVPVLANGSVEELHTAVDSLAEIAAGIRSGLAKISAAKVPMSRARPTAARPAPTAAVDPAGDVDGGFKFDKATRAILTVLVQYPQGRDKRQLGLLAGYSPKGGGFNNALSRLRTAGLITAGGDPIRATEGAADLLGDVEPLPTGADLLNYWLARLGKAEREILIVLWNAEGAELTKEEVAERTESGYAPTGGGFNNAISALRTRELIEGRGALRASKGLFG